MKTKEEIIIELDQVILLQELQNIRVMDALEEVLDYVKSSEDRRAMMNEYFSKKENEL